MAVVIPCVTGSGAHLAASCWDSILPNLNTPPHPFTAPWWPFRYRVCILHRNKPNLQTSMESGEVWHESWSIRFQEFFWSGHLKRRRYSPLKMMVSERNFLFGGTSFQVPCWILGVYIHSTSKKDSSSKQRMYVRINKFQEALRSKNKKRDACPS